MGTVQALLFDFNGTLSNDEPYLLAIYQELFARHGRPLPEEEYWERLAGLSDDAIIGGWLGVDGPLRASLVAERVDRYAEAADGSTMTGQVRDAVRYAAARVPVAIVSGAFRAEIEPVVQAAGIAALITTIVAADDVTSAKPDPEAYLAALERLGVEAGAAIAFEDTEAGIASAKGAGLRVVAVLGTLPLDRLAQADEHVTAIDVALIERLLA